MCHPKYSHIDSGYTSGGKYLLVTRSIATFPGSPRELLGSAREVHRRAVDVSASTVEVLTSNPVNPMQAQRYPNHHAFRVKHWESCIRYIAANGEAKDGFPLPVWVFDRACELLKTLPTAQPAQPTTPND